MQHAQLTRDSISLRYWKNMSRINTSFLLARVKPLFCELPPACSKMNPPSINSFRIFAKSSLLRSNSSQSVEDKNSRRPKKGSLTIRCIHAKMRGNLLELSRASSTLKEPNGTSQLAVEFQVAQLYLFVREACFYTCVTKFGLRRVGKVAIAFCVMVIKTLHALNLQILINRHGVGEEQDVSLTTRLLSCLETLHSHLI